MKVSPEDVRTRLDAWRGVGACTASCFMASRALSRGARTNGAVCAAPGGSRHHLYHRLSCFRWREARGEARAGREQLQRCAGAGRDRLRLRRCVRADAGEARRLSVASALAGAANDAALLMLVLLVLTVADTLLEQALPRGGVVELSASHLQGMGGLWIESPEYVRN
jgi:hypothetical protein